MPFPDRTVDAVYCGHVLEHLTFEVELPAALAEIRRVLTDAGRVCVVGPDCDRVWNDPEWHVLADVVAHGGDRWPGDRHQWRSTGPVTLEAMRPWFPTAQEIDIHDVDRTLWPLVDDPGWQFAITT